MFLFSAGARDTRGGLVAHGPAVAWLMLMLL
jgi:hypothetical protein